MSKTMIRTVMTRRSPALLALMAFCAIPSGAVPAADSTSYTPVNIPWQKPSASTADSATYATNAGQAESAATATTATTANALCPSCTISGSQVSGTVANATNAANATYANSSGYANNAGYASSSAASIGGCYGDGQYTSTSTIYPTGTMVEAGYVGNGSSTWNMNAICVNGSWAHYMVSIVGGGPS